MPYNHCRCVCGHKHQGRRCRAKACGCSIFELDTGQWSPPFMYMDQAFRWGPGAPVYVYGEAA